MTDAPIKTVLLVTADAALQARLVRCFPQASVFVATADGDALRTLQLVEEVEAVVRDSRRPAASLAAFVGRVRELNPRTLVIAIAPPDGETDSADLALADTFSQRELDAALRQAADRQQLLREIASLRAQLAPAPPAESGTPPSSRDALALARTLTEFGRVLAAGFDLPRVLDLFLDAIGELLRPARSALLLPEGPGPGYRIRAHRAMPPPLVTALRLSAAGGLSRWLLSQGRPARRGEVADPDAARELALLGGCLAVPLVAHGDLEAILVVGQPVVGGSYGRHEMEIVFDLASHLAIAIRDITLHHQLARQKEFNEQILAHMSSGVITIGPDERVGVFNRRAEEILGLPAAEVVGQDLRILPSPLGDMLYESLVRGRAVTRTEVRLALRSLWVEVSTYPIGGSGPGPAGAGPAAQGAVLVLEDRTAQKELAARKRQAEEFQLLSTVIARIADEIKNPLVSISTFGELIEERYEDADFRKQFSAVVRRDVRRLLQVFEKLAGLVSQGELHCTTVDIHTTLEEVITAIELADDSLGKRPHLELNRGGPPAHVRIDVTQFRKALSYLVWYLAHHSPGEEARVTIAAGRVSDGEGEQVRLLIGSRTATVPADKLERLFDPVRAVQESLIDVGPAVSQRLLEAQGGRVQYRQGRHELAFQVTLPAVQP